jgi:hypothetical protein
MDYILYFENLVHELKLTEIKFSDNGIMIVDTDDYYATSEDEEDGYWEEYYSIEGYQFDDIINRLENNYKPIRASDLDLQTISKLEQLKNNNAKFIFLYILSINKYQKNIAEKENKNIRGKELINILCGKDIEYKYYTYSKGP